MFAFALWDRTAKRADTRARPLRHQAALLLHDRANGSLFGSEVKALLSHPASSAGIDREGLLEYFTFQNFFTDRTLLRRRAPAAGRALHADARAWPASRDRRPTRYWDFAFEEPEGLAPTSRISRSWTTCSRRRSTGSWSATSTSARISGGGMDSGSITAIAAQLLPYMRTFTCGFDLSSASGIELELRRASRRPSTCPYLFKTEHYEMVLKAGDMERAMPQLAWHLEEPRVGQSYPNFYVAQLASKFVKVVLSGTGGDELFGGYPWRYYRAVVNRRFRRTTSTSTTNIWQRLAPDGSARQIFEPIWSEVEHVVDAGDLPRRVSGPRVAADAAGGLRQSLAFTSRPRPSCTAC